MLEPPSEVGVWVTNCRSKSPEQFRNEAPPAGWDFTQGWPKGLPGLAAEHFPEFGAKRLYLGVVIVYKHGPDSQRQFTILVKDLMEHGANCDAQLRGPWEA